MKNGRPTAPRRTAPALLRVSHLPPQIAHAVKCSECGTMTVGLNGGQWCTWCGKFIALGIGRRTSRCTQQPPASWVAGGTENSAARFAAGAFPGGCE